jgi:hypothetical protein
VSVRTYISKKLGSKLQFDSSRMCEMNTGFRMISSEGEDIKQSAGLYGQFTEVVALPAFFNSSNLSWKLTSRHNLSRVAGLFQISKTEGAGWDDFHLPRVEVHPNRMGCHNLSSARSQPFWQCIIIFFRARYVPLVIS